MLVFFGIFLKVSVQDHITKCSLQNLTNFYGVGLKPVYLGVYRKRVGGKKSPTTFFPIPADCNRIRGMFIIVLHGFYTCSTRVHFRVLHGFYTGPTRVLHGSTTRVLHWFYTGLLHWFYTGSTRVLLHIMIMRFNKN